MPRGQIYQNNVIHKISGRTMPILLALLAGVTIISTSFTDTDDCKKLGDGKYKVQFKRFPQSNYILHIDKNQFIKTDRKGQETKGTIEWSGECYFVLSSDTATMGNSVMEKIKLGLGDPCYELMKTKGRVTSFRITRTGNLNILIDEGKLKKID